MRIARLLFDRRRELERLFTVTAGAFARRVPPPRRRGTLGRLHEYASFTQECATRSLAAGNELAAIEHRLFRGAFLIGASLRRSLRVRSLAEALRAARLVYRGVGIDFRAGTDGSVLIRRCRFAATYSKEVCVLMSTMDRGLLAGLAYYRELRFERRITEGAPACTACLARRFG